MADMAANNLILQENPSGFKGGSLLKRHGPFLILLVVYLAINLLTLTKYPRVHDDEGVLANFAYELHKSGIPIIDTSESNLGYVKGLTIVPLSGILFYSSLALIGHIWGFGLYAMRIQPLFFAVVSIILTYVVGSTLFGDRTKALLSAFLLASSSKFLVAAHMVRQESMWIAGFLGMFLLFLLGLNRGDKKYLWASAFLSGLGICIHPNGVLMPLVLMALVIARRQDWPERIAPILIQMGLAALLGGLLFVFLDYLPAREYYWPLFHSDLFRGLSTDRYKDLFWSFPYVVWELLAGLWNDFWVPRYHRNMFYLAIHILALAGAVVFRRREHTLLCFVLFFLLLMLLPLHVSPFYFAYFVPFFSLLLGSVLKDSWKIWPTAARGLSTVVLLLAVAHPLATLWSFRNYDFKHISREIVSVVEGGGNIMGSHAFFFAVPAERLFSRYTLIRYDLKKLMAEVPLQFFILDRFTSSFVDAGNTAEPFAAANAGYLQEDCQKSRVVADMAPRFASSANPSDKIVIYDCGKAEISIR